MNWTHFITQWVGWFPVATHDLRIKSKWKKKGEGGKVKIDCKIEHKIGMTCAHTLQLRVLKANEEKSFTNAAKKRKSEWKKEWIK